MSGNADEIAHKLVGPAKDVCVNLLKRIFIGLCAVFKTYNKGRVYIAVVLDGKALVSAFEREAVDYKIRLERL